MKTTKSLQEYINELSSGSPTPGGGNVSAFCGVLACSLGIMVCNLTIGKKKYADVENEIKDVFNNLEKFKSEFIKLADEDNKAFDKVMEAFRLPKETDFEKQTRSEKIEQATLDAAVVPSKVIETCRSVYPFFKTVAAKGNRNSVSDAGVAASLLLTASEGAFLNVMINCYSLSNRIIGNEFLKNTEVIFEEVKMNAENILNDVKKKLISE
jgi:methenyltetrahydrofolate cyclohydrolase